MPEHVRLNGHEPPHYSERTAERRPERNGSDLDEGEGRPGLVAG